MKSIFQCTSCALWKIGPALVHVHTLSDSLIHAVKWTAIATQKWAKTISCYEYKRLNFSEREENGTFFQAFVEKSKSQPSRKMRRANTRNTHRVRSSNLSSEIAHMEVNMFRWDLYSTNASWAIHFFYHCVDIRSYSTSIGANSLFFPPNLLSICTSPRM